jgi:hypothetical protein
VLATSVTGTGLCPADDLRHSEGRTRAGRAGERVGRWESDCRYFLFQGPVVSLAGMSRAGQQAIAGRLTAGSSRMGESGVARCGLSCAPQCAVCGEHPRVRHAGNEVRREWAHGIGPQRYRHADVALAAGLPCGALPPALPRPGFRAVTSSKNTPSLSRDVLVARVTRIEGTVSSA